MIMDRPAFGRGRDQAIEEPEKLRTRVPLGGHALDSAGGDIECGIERQGAIALVLEAVAFRPTGRQRQDRIQPIERLDVRLLVDRKDHRVGRRLEVQPDHVRRFGLEVRIGAGEVPFEAMRLEPGALPYPMDGDMADADQTGPSAAWSSG